MDNWLIYLAIVAALIVLLVFLRYGAKAAAVAGAALSALWIYLAGRKGQRTEIENEVAREELNNEIERNERIVAADRAGDAARDVPADRLRDPDPFEIK